MLDVMDLILQLGATIAICVGLAWLILYRRRVSRFQRAVFQECCKVCGCSFSDTFPDFRGRLTKDDSARLDNFQKRFAAYRVYCNNCSAMCLCTKDGRVISGYVIRD
jgi:hypothetical protein